MNQHDEESFRQFVAARLGPLAEVKKITDSITPADLSTPNSWPPVTS